MNAIRGQRWLACFALVIVLGCIALLSAQPHSAAFTGKIFGSYNHIARKTAHVSEFAVAMLVLAWVLRLFWHRAHWFLTASIGAVAAISYAGLDEWHQSFVPGRTACLSDVAIDSCGVAVAFVAVCVFHLVCSLRSRR